MRKKNKKYVWIVTSAIVLIALAIIFLRPQPLTVVPSGYGLLQMGITDAPPSLNITNVYINISGIRVHYSGNPTAVNESERYMNETGWKSVREEEIYLDLIELRESGIDALLGTVPLRIGQYTQIRLDINSATVIADGIAYPLTIPSRELKLTNGFDIQEENTLKLTLDFDANESIHETGIGSYLMRPTVRVLTR